VGTARWISWVGGLRRCVLGRSRLEAVGMAVRDGPGLVGTEGTTEGDGGQSAYWGKADPLDQMQDLGRWPNSDNWRKRENGIGSGER